MSKISLAQQKFLLSQKKHRQIVTISRLCIFVLFFGLWEGAAQLNLIDSFFFSSPSRVIICAYDHFIRDHCQLYIGNSPGARGNHYLMAEQKNFRDIGTIFGNLEQPA